MRTRTVAEVQQEILVLAPWAGDHLEVERVFKAAGIDSRTCNDLRELAILAAEGCGCAFVAQEGLATGSSHLIDVIQRQPPWSDLPVIVALTPRANLTQVETQLLERLGNVQLIERPFRADALVSIVRAALRARERQYQMRDLVRERADLLATLELRVTERTADLTASNEELQAFSYTVSHDLRSPLRTMAGFAEILLEEFQSGMSERAVDCASRISRAAKRLDQLTCDLLKYSRIVNGDLIVESVDVETTIKAVIDEYPSIAAAKPYIRIVPPLGVVLAHPSSLTQSFANLLENAIKFAAPGQPPSIHIRSEVGGGVVRIWIEDRGIGIAPQHHEKIFRIFETVSAPEGSQTGIGLALVRKAVERMGGAVGVASRLGDGAKFWIELRPPCAA